MATLSSWPGDFLADEGAHRKRKPLLASKAFEEQCRGRLTKVIIETDCARVYLAVKSDSQDRPEIGFIIEEIKGLACLLLEWRFSQANRESNQVTNALASFARCSKSEATNWGRGLACVEEFLIADCINILPS
jgi:hypothetical protein